MKDRLSLLEIKLLCVCGLIVGGAVAVLVTFLIMPPAEFLEKTWPLTGFGIGFIFSAGVIIANILMWLISGAGFLERLVD